MGRILLVGSTKMSSVKITQPKV